MKLGKLIKMLQKVEASHGPNVQVQQKNFAICSAENPAKVVVSPGEYVGRRQADKPYKILTIESGRYRDYVENPDS
jgi:hypothetical protein